MVFEGLADKLQQTFKKLKGRGKLTENDVTRSHARSYAWRFLKQM